MCNATLVASCLSQLINLHRLSSESLETRSKHHEPYTQRYATDATNH